MVTGSMTNTSMVWMSEFTVESTTHSSLDVSDTYTLSPFSGI